MNKVCLDCFKIIETSIRVNAEYIELNNRIMSLPNTDLVCFKQFSKLSSDALDILSQNPTEDFDVQKKIAGGSFGTVYQVVEKATGKKLAVKIVKYQNIIQRKLILNEYILTKLSNHPNIIKYYLIYERNDEVWIIQELMKTSLASILSKIHPLPEGVIVYILKEVLKGIDFIHKHYRIHRDIKSDNILLDLEGNVKVCDMGFAAQLTSEQLTRSTLAGTPCWLAPELASMQPYDCKADIWSFGVLAIELVEAEPPMIRANIQNVIRSILNGEIGLSDPESVTPQLANLIQMCLVPEPKFRKSASELLEEEIFNKTISKTEYIAYMIARYSTML
jgi:serine/threonine protein kinase